MLTTKKMHPTLPRPMTRMEVARSEAAARGEMNLKDIIGGTRLPLQLIPAAAKAHIAHALSDGAEKYGPYNWRETQILLTEYLGAMQRHIDALLDGEDHSADTTAAGHPVHHLAHVAAGCCIVLDALELGLLVDDRPAPGNAARVHEQLRRSPPSALTPRGVKGG